MAAILLIVIAFVIGALISVGFSVLYYRKGMSAKQQKLEADVAKAEEDAERVIGEAQKNAESRKRELLLQAKEEITNAKLDLEKDVRERKSEIARERNRLEQKEESLNRKIEAIDECRKSTGESLPSQRCNGYGRKGKRTGTSESDRTGEGFRIICK